MRRAGRLPAATRRAEPLDVSWTDPDEPRSRWSSAGTGETIGDADGWSFHKGFGLGLAASVVTFVAHVVMTRTGAWDGSAPRLEDWEAGVVLAVAAGAWLLCGAAAGWSIEGRLGLAGFATALGLFAVFIVAGGLAHSEGMARIGIPETLKSAAVATVLALAGLYGYRIGVAERTIHRHREAELDSLDDEGWPTRAAEAAIREWEREAESRGLLPETA